MFEQLLDQADSAQARYLQTGDLSTLDDSITVWQRILQHPDFATVDTESRLMILNDSANTYWRRYRAKGEISDLDRALSAWQTIVTTTPPESPYLPGILNNLGGGLRTRYRYARTGDLTDLQAGIENYQQAVSLTLVGSPDLPMYLNNLGNGLTHRYDCTGDLTDLQAGIENYQQAVSLTPVGTPDLPMYLNNLGTGLRARYVYTGNLTDLQAGIAVYQQAEQLTPTGSPDLPTILNNLGNVLRARYARMDDPSDLQAGIKAYQRAVRLTPAGSPDLPRHLNNLGTGLRNRYARTDDLTDLQAGIENYQQAVSLTPTGAPDLPMYLSNLGNGLTDRYACTDDLSDLQAGIEAYQRAVSLTPAGSPNLPCNLNNLGTGLTDRYARTGDLTDLQAGIKAFQEASESEGPLSDRLVATRNWLNAEFEQKNWLEIEKIYPKIQQFSKELVEKQLLREHQEAFLQETQGIAVKVAYARIQTNHWPEAAEALEQGVARLLSAALMRSRADLSQLQQDHPDLATKYETGLTELQNAERAYQHASPEWQPARLHDLQQQRQIFDEVLRQIRQVSGHEHFLLIPTSLNTVYNAAQTTPLVYLFTTDKGGYALIVFQEEKPQAVALPELTETILREKMQAYFTAYSSHSEAWFDTLEEMTQWLWQVIWQPLTTPNPSLLRRGTDDLSPLLIKEGPGVVASPLTTKPGVVLIPVGLLNLLPLHAAWRLDDTGQKHYVLDDFTIAYAPNALSLQKARERASLKPENLLAIDEPKPVNAGALPSSSTEVKMIATTFNTSSILRHEQATCDAVLDALPTIQVLHLSCHGHANLADPLQSCLMMAYNEELTVAELLDLRLDRGIRLVTLSACETGMIGTKQIEEVVGLPASLLQAGVAGVAASLWSVNDFSTALLMIRFYDYWRGKQLPPAEALRQAQLWVRDTTNKEKRQYLKEHHQSAFVSQLANSYDTERKHTHPVYWAAFGYTGV